MPSQPSKQEAYKTPGNAVSKEPAERIASTTNAQSSSSGTVEKRFPNDQPTSSKASQSTPGQNKAETLGEHGGFEAGGMVPAPDGKVRDAVVGDKTGASGAEPDMASELDAKVPRIPVLHERLD